MICLTGDIHHDSLKINDQRFIPDGMNEIEICGKYLELLKKYNLKVTFYTTGMTFQEQWEEFKAIAEADNVEIGGHTFSGLPRKTESTDAATGLPSCSHAHSHGTYEDQEQDVQKMIGIAEEKTGKKLLTWRSHGLVKDENTEKILFVNGIRFISDELNWNKILPEKTEAGLISHPMNVLMDHDHLFHAHRTCEYVERQRKNWPFKDAPTNRSFEIDKWGRIVRAQIQAIDEMGGLATILMHPLCMYLADGFKTAEKIFEFIASLKTKCVWASETEEFLGKK
ncbi:MAG: hypothetical protein A2017_18570 [Lentisphaerae bacterium GWF2_44_16]|nr:MAG: hypothetical protein A2017_18570 [Lentisphaerae bacterium GWF2_44_16]